MVVLSHRQIARSQSKFVLAVRIRTVSQQVLDALLKTGQGRVVEGRAARVIFGIDVDPFPLARR